MSRIVCALGLMLMLGASDLSAEIVLTPLRYELDLEVDYASEMLRGAALIVVENPSTEPARDVSLLLYRLLRVASVRDDKDADLPFSQTVVAFEDFGELQVNQIVVTLPKPLAPGAKTAIRVEYEGHLLGYAETGMAYVKDRIDPEFTILRDDAWAFPRPGVPSVAVNQSAPPWGYSYLARVTVPEGFTVANGGRLEGTEAHGDKVTFRYSNLKPCWRMDFAIAKYGRLSAGPFRVYYLPGDSLGAVGVATAAGTAQDLYTRWFGPLSESAGLSFIEIPDGWGSQADVTTVIQTAAAFRDPERHNEVYHEISHLWNVTPTDRPSPRWNEGLASFLENVVTQEVTGKPVVDEQAAMLVEWLRGALPDHPEWRETPLKDYGRKGLTDLSYSVGALYFDLLYRLVGRESFRKIIGEYVVEFRARGGSTDDLVNVVRKHAEMDVSALATDWIYTTGWTGVVERNPRIQDLDAYYRGLAQEKKKSE